MQKSLIIAVLGLILPSFIYQYTFLAIQSFALLGIGWIWLFSSTGLGDINYLGIYLFDPKIFVTPGEWSGFQSTDGILSELFLRSFFSDSLSGNANSLSIYGILFTLGLIAGIIGLILLFSSKKYAAAALVTSGILGLISLLLFNQTATDSIIVNNTLPIPLGSILLLVAGIFAYSEKD